MPADEIVKGLNAFTEQPRRRTKKQGGQWTTTRSFLGPQALAAAKEDELLLEKPLSISTELGVPAKIEIETEDGGGTVEVGSQAERDSTSLRETVWELAWDKLNTDLRDNSYVKYIAGSGNKYTEAVDTAIAKGTASLINWTALYGADVQKYCDCKLQGINSFVQFNPIIRATITASYNTEILAVPQGHAGQIVLWAAIKIPGAGTLEHWHINEPTLWVRGEGGRWGATAKLEWMIQPVEKRFVRSTHQWVFVHEWSGAASWCGFLYENGTGTPIA